MNTAQKFKTIRMGLGFSQRGLGKIFNVDQSTINKIEQGVNGLSREMGSKLVEYCKEQKFYLGTKTKKIEITLDYLLIDDK